MKKIRELTGRDIRFLKNLDSQLRTVTPHHDPHARPAYRDFVSEDFSNRKLSEREIKRILGISRKNNAFLYPTTTQFGFATVFGIASTDLTVGNEPVTELLLRVRESQLPEDYDFENLSSYFMEKGNLATARLAGIKIQNDRTHYTY
ncbi:MAG: hypothetical protein ABIH49_02920 [archaeon]